MLVSSILCQNGLDCVMKVEVTGFLSSVVPVMNYHPSDPTHLLSMAPPSDRNSPDGWPQSGVSWQSTGEIL